MEQTAEAKVKPGHRMPGHKKNRTPLWKQPKWCLFFVLSLILSGCLVVIMPQPQMMKKSMSRQNQAEQAMPVPKQQAPVLNAQSGPEIQAGSPAAEKDHAGTGKTDQKAGHAKKHAGMAQETALDKILYRLHVFGRLFFFVGLGALLGAVVDGRGWYRFFAGSLGRLARMARMPAIVSMAAPVALTSAPAADSMLVASHNKGELSSATLIAGGMLNSFLAHFSHTMRIFYPVVAAIGLPGVLFFLIQFGGMSAFILAVLLWHRVTMAKKQNLPGGEYTEEESLAAKILPWKETLQKGFVRAGNLLFRLVCISLPLLLLMEYCLNSGMLDFWDKLVPEAVSSLIPEQLLTILAAQLSGLVQSSAICAGLKAQGLISDAQILLAMLLASAVTNPLRTLRRNLPTALAIFPARTALAIVLSMQIVRFIIMMAASVIVLIWMQAHI